MNFTRLIPVAVAVVAACGLAAPAAVAAEGRNVPFSLFGDAERLQGWRGAAAVGRRLRPGFRRGVRQERVRVPRHAAQLHLLGSRRHRATTAALVGDGQVIGIQVVVDSSFTQADGEQTIIVNPTVRLDTRG